MPQNKLETYQKRKGLQTETDIAQDFAELRKAKGITQKELESLTGIRQAEISKFENGSRKPSLHMLNRLAEGIGMALEIRFVPKRDKTKTM